MAIDEPALILVFELVCIALLNRLVYQLKRKREERRLDPAFEADKRVVSLVVVQERI